VSGPVTSAEAIALIEAARGPDDLFGADAARDYRQLAQLTHPDAHPGDDRAADAFAKLAALWRQHRDGPGPLVARGDIANLYPVSRGLLKLARDPADNDLMRAETIALTRLRHEADERLRAYFPELIAARRLQDPHSGVQRRANVIGRLTGVDPQIMFGAIGDATCDRAPLQVGQFESDNRMDDDLGRILLEGGDAGKGVAVLTARRWRPLCCHPRGCRPRGCRRWRGAGARGGPLQRGRPGRAQRADRRP
jgi:hypothetical protein